MMKKLILLFVWAMLPLMASASVKAVTVKDINYVIDSETHIAIVVNPNGAKKPSVYKGDVVIPSEIEYDSEYYTVNAIDQYAFYQCADLTSVTFESTVTSSIGDYAFYDCTSLVKVKFGMDLNTIGKYSFYNCSALTDHNMYNLADIPDYAFAKSGISSSVVGSNVSTIGESAFEECPNFEYISLSIGDALTTIGKNAFRNSGLQQFRITVDLTDIDFSAFAYTKLSQIEVPEEHPLYEPSDGMTVNAIIEKSTGKLILGGGSNVIIPSFVSTIAENAFLGNSNVSEVSIPNSVTSIGQYAFAGCSNLNTVTIPKSVTKIDAYVFADCASLYTVRIYTEEAPTLDANAFDGCNKTGISIETGYFSTGFDQGGWEEFSLMPNKGEEVTVGDFKFKLNKGLKPAFVYNYNDVEDLVIPETVEYEGFTYDVVAIDDDGFAYNNTITSISIPKSIRLIGDHAFSGCQELTEVTIPSTVKYMGSGIFCFCPKLKSATFQNGVTLVPDVAFNGCDNLETVVLPASTASIEAGAFSGCPELKDVFCHAVAAPAVAADAFDTDKLSGVTLYIPNSPTGYDVSPWKDFGKVAEAEKLEAPTVTVEEGNLVFGCNAKDVTYHYTIANTNAKDGTTDEKVAFTQDFTITVYASKKGCDDSPETVKTIKVKKGDVNGDGVVNITDVTLTIDIVLGK